MGIASRSQLYSLLCAVKRGEFGGKLTEEESKFMQEFAREKLEEVLKDPLVKELFEQMVAEQVAKSV